MNNTKVVSDYDRIYYPHTNNDGLVWASFLRAFITANDVIVTLHNPVNKTHIYLMHIGLTLPAL